jgi:hypothetical protein
LSELRCSKSAAELAVEAVAAVVAVAAEAAVLLERPGLGRGVVAVELRQLERERRSVVVAVQLVVVVGDKLRQPLWRA